MKGRIGILVAIFAFAVALLALQHLFWAAISFLLSLISLLEILMFSLMPYSHGSIRLSKAREAIKIDGNLLFQPIEGKLLCIPVMLSFPWYTMNKLVAKIKAGDLTINSCTFYENGESEYNDEFFLDFRIRKLLIAIGYSESGNIVFGTPVWHKYPLERNQNYSVVIEILHIGKLITSAIYSVTPTLDIQDVRRIKNAKT